MKQRILFVDDEPNVLSSYQRSLRDQHYRWDMEFESCPLTALQRLRDVDYDTVVSDVRMPGMTGVELLATVKADPKLCQVPFIIVTGEADRDLKRKALDLDAADLLNKPVDVDDLVARVSSSLRTKFYADELKRSNDELSDRVRERTADLEASRIDIIWRLGKAAEYRDEETGNHVIRVGCFSRSVARSMGMDEAFCDTLFLAAPLHDIGKIGIPDAILLKEGKLSDDEWQVMRSHCRIGASILSDGSKVMDAARRLAHIGPAGLGRDRPDNPIIDMAVSVASSHHEHWDGNGYPLGLAGEKIPIAGRIVAVADVFDALRSRRTYKEPYSVERTVGIISEESGSHFDPVVVRAFHDALPEILAAERKYTEDVQYAASDIQSHPVTDSDIVAAS